MVSEEHASIYKGWFGTLCKHVPMFDASAPNGWRLTYRAYDRTDWAHPETGVYLTCIKTSDGWNLFVEADGDVYQTLPIGALRWNAFGAARAFMEGEPLLPADMNAEIEGVLTIERFRSKHA
ncbi:hypothetical protein ACFQGT_00085 [Natrialbaceae archaeon GCM10025810]